MQRHLLLPDRKVVNKVELLHISGGLESFGRHALTVYGGRHLGLPPHHQLHLGESELRGLVHRGKILGRPGRGQNMLCEEGLRFQGLLDQDLLIGAPAEEVVEGEFWERQLR
jgi:hypothetical protein